MTEEPCDRVARYYLARKGFAQVAPRHVTKLDDQPCWYYVYDLPDKSVLELEVSWDGREWQTIVTTFTPA